jgi:hypothetical protein
VCSDVCVCNEDDDVFKDDMCKDDGVVCCVLF